MDLPGNSANKMRKTEMDVNVDRTAVLGGEPAEMVCGVDEGNEEHKPQSRIQQTNFYCEENRQRSGNTNGNIPGAHELPLVGEWIVCASSKVSRESASIDEAEAFTQTLAECCQQLASVDGDAGRKVEPTDTTNVSEAPITMSVDLENSDSSDIPCMYLGSTNWHAGNANRLGNRADGLSRQMDEPKEFLTMSVEPYVKDGGDIPCMYLGSRANASGCQMDGVGNHADASNRSMDTPSIKMNAMKPANIPEIIRTPRKKEKLPDLPVEAARCTPEESDGLGDRTDTLSIRTYVHCIGNDVGAAEKEAENVRTPQNRQKMRNSPNACEIAMPEPICRCKRVSVDNVDVYVPCNAPVEVLGRTVVFGEVEGGETVIVPNVEGERAGNGDGD